MKAKQRKLSSGPIEIKTGNLLSGIKTEGAFQDKVDKANHILKTVGLPKKGKA
jgi:hypothetical protein